MNSLTIEYGQLFLYLYDKIVARPVFESCLLGNWLKIVPLEHLVCHGKYSFPMLDAVLGFNNLLHCGVHLLHFCRHVSIVTILGNFLGLIGSSNPTCCPPIEQPHPLHYIHLCRIFRFFIFGFYHSLLRSWILYKIRQINIAYPVILSHCICYHRRKNSQQLEKGSLVPTLTKIFITLSAEQIFLHSSHTWDFNDEPRVKYFLKLIVALPRVSPLRAGSQEAPCLHIAYDK